MFGGVEGGGTKFVCAVGTGPGDLRERTVIATSTPAQTLAGVAAHLRRFELEAVGIASFGPLELARGRISSTPKPGWAGTELVAALRSALGALPVALDTDVNGAALGEWRWGAAAGLDTFVYVTVGTGVGGGGMAGGHLMHGLIHPEMGHIRLPRHPLDPLATGACPFHPDCWEGWAAKRAIEKRWGEGVQASDLGEDELELLAHYVAAGVTNLIFTLSPRRVILGGGVVLSGGHRERMLGSVRRQVTELLGGYFEAQELGAGIGDYIVAPALGGDAGVLGAIALAQRAAGAEGGT